MSSRPSHSAAAGGRAPDNGHTPAEGWTQIEYNRTARRHRSDPIGRSGSVRHPRRVAAARARRRRLLAIDLAIAFALGLAAIVIAGLALVALVALSGLLACVVSLTRGRMHERRAVRERTHGRAPRRPR